MQLSRLALTSGQYPTARHYPHRRHHRKSSAGGEDTAAEKSTETRLRFTKVAVGDADFSFSDASPWCVLPKVYGCQPLPPHGPPPAPYILAEQLPPLLAALASLYRPWDAMPPWAAVVLCTALRYSWPLRAAKSRLLPLLHHLFPPRAAGALVGDMLPKRLPFATGPQSLFWAPAEPLELVDLCCARLVITRGSDTWLGPSQHCDIECGWEDLPSPLDPAVDVASLASLKTSSHRCELSTFWPDALTGINTLRKEIPVAFRPGGPFYCELPSEIAARTTHCLQYMAVGEEAVWLHRECNGRITALRIRVHSAVAQLTNWQSCFSRADGALPQWPAGSVYCALPYKPPLFVARWRLPKLGRTDFSDVLTGCDAQFTVNARVYQGWNVNENKSHLAMKGLPLGAFPSALQWAITHTPENIESEIWLYDNRPGNVTLAGLTNLRQKTTTSAKLCQFRWSLASSKPNPTALGWRQLAHHLKYVAMGLLLDFASGASLLADCVCISSDLPGNLHRALTAGTRYASVMLSASTDHRYVRGHVALDDVAECLATQRNTTWRRFMELATAPGYFWHIRKTNLQQLVVTQTRSTAEGDGVWLGSPPRLVVVLTTELPTFQREIVALQSAGGETVSVVPPGSRPVCLRPRTLGQGPESWLRVDACDAGALCLLQEATAPAAEMKGLRGPALLLAHASGDLQEVWTPVTELGHDEAVRAAVYDALQRHGVTVGSSWVRCRRRLVVDSLWERAFVVLQPVCFAAEDEPASTSAQGVVAERAGLLGSAAYRTAIHRYLLRFWQSQSTTTIPGVLCRLLPRQSCAATEDTVPVLPAAGISLGRWALNAPMPESRGDSSSCLRAVAMLGVLSALEQQIRSAKPQGRLAVRLSLTEDDSRTTPLETTLRWRRTAVEAWLRRAVSCRSQQAGPLVKLICWDLVVAGNSGLVPNFQEWRKLLASGTLDEPALIHLVAAGNVVLGSEKTVVTTNDERLDYDLPLLPAVVHQQAAADCLARLTDGGLGGDGESARLLLGIPKGADYVTGTELFTDSLMAAQRSSFLRGSRRRWTREVCLALMASTLRRARELVSCSGCLGPAELGDMIAYEVEELERCLDLNGDPSALSQLSVGTLRFVAALLRVKDVNRATSQAEICLSTLLRLIVEEDRRRGGSKCDVLTALWELASYWATALTFVAYYLQDEDLLVVYETLAREGRRMARAAGHDTAAGLPLGPPELPPASTQLMTRMGVPLAAVDGWELVGHKELPAHLLIPAREADSGRPERAALAAVMLHNLFSRSRVVETWLQRARLVAPVLQLHPVSAHGNPREVARDAFQRCCLRTACWWQGHTLAASLGRPRGMQFAESLANVVPAMQASNERTWTRGDDAWQVPNPVPHPALTGVPVATGAVGPWHMVLVLTDGDLVVAGSSGERQLGFAISELPVLFGAGQDSLPELQELARHVADSLCVDFSRGLQAPQDQDDILPFALATPLRLQLHDANGEPMCAETVCVTAKCTVVRTRDRRCVVLGHGEPPCEIQLPGGTAQVVAGLYHVAAISGSGGLFTWGRNDGGQLGMLGNQLDETIEPQEVALFALRADDHGKLADNDLEAIAGALMTSAEAGKGSARRRSRSSASSRCSVTNTSVRVFWCAEWRALFVQATGPATRSLQLGLLLKHRVHFHQAACGEAHTLATGRLPWGASLTVAFGDNGSHELGPICEVAEVQASQLRQVGDLTELPPSPADPNRATPLRLQGSVRHLEAGGLLSGIVDAKRQLWLWGSNEAGLLGVPHETSSEPFRLSQVSIDEFRSLSFAPGGTLHVVTVRGSVVELGKQTAEVRVARVAELQAPRNWCRWRRKMAASTPPGGSLARQVPILAEVKAVAGGPTGSLFITGCPARLGSQEVKWSVQSSKRHVLLVTPRTCRSGAPEPPPTPAATRITPEPDGLAEILLPAEPPVGEPSATTRLPSVSQVRGHAAMAQLTRIGLEGLTKLTEVVTRNIVDRGVQSTERFAEIRAQRELEAEAREREQEQAIVGPSIYCAPRDPVPQEWRLDEMQWRVCSEPYWTG